MSQPPEDVRWPTYPPQPVEPAQGSQFPVPVVPSDLPLPALQEPPTPQPARAGYSPSDPLLLSAGGTSVKKDGVWTVPPYVSIHGDFGTVRLDFRRAQLASRVTWVQVSGGAGTIILILPEGWAAQLDRVAPGLGTKKSTVLEEPTGGSPVLVFTGSLGMGTLKIRYPNRRDERRLRRLLAREQRRAR